MKTQKWVLVLSHSTPQGQPHADLTDLVAKFIVQAAEQGAMLTSKPEDIPQRWVKLANEAIDSKLWRSSTGEEYSYTCDAEWLVTNERLGPYRIRSICRIVKEVKIGPGPEPSG